MPHRCLPELPATKLLQVSDSRLLSPGVVQSTCCFHGSVGSLRYACGRRISATARMPNLGGGCYFSVGTRAPCLSVCLVLIYCIDCLIFFSPLEGCFLVKCGVDPGRVHPCAICVFRSVTGPSKARAKSIYFGGCVLQPLLGCWLSSWQ